MVQHHWVFPWYKPGCIGALDVVTCIHPGDTGWNVKVYHCVYSMRGSEHLTRDQAHERYCRHVRCHTVAEAVAVLCAHARCSVLHSMQLSSETPSTGTAVCQEVESLSLGVCLCLWWWWCSNTRPFTSPLCGSGGWSLRGSGGMCCCYIRLLYLVSAWIAPSLLQASYCQHVCVRFTFTLLLLC